MGARRQGYPSVMSEQRAANESGPEQIETDTSPEGADPDAVSDPARDDETGGDWTTEGGATQQGPATSADD